MATRVYLPSTGTPSISPAFGSGWAVPAADRRAAVRTRISSAITQKNGAGDAATGNHLVRQYVLEEALAAQTISGTIKGQVCCCENHSGVNAALAIRVAKCASDGSGVVQILAISKSSDLTATPPEFPVEPDFGAAAFTNRRFETGSDTFSLTLGSTAVDAGDFLIIEIGYNDAATQTTRFAAMFFGDNGGTDLPENETDTDEGKNSWVEFSMDITFQGAGGVTASPTGVAATGEVGTIAVSGKANVPLTGAEGTGAAGTIAVVLNTPVALTGAEAVGAAGAIGMTGQANVPVPGVEAIGQVGDFTISGEATVELVGVSAAGAAGTITVDTGTGEVTVILAGVAATGAAGDVQVSGKALTAVPGVSAAGEVGVLAIAAAAMASLSGVLASGQVGSLATFTSVTVTVPGVFADGQAGLIQVTGTANVPLSGVEAQALIGLLTVIVGTLQASDERVIRVQLAGRTVDVELSSRVVRVTAANRTIQ